MAIFKRKVKGTKLECYYMKFTINGKQYLRSCRTLDRKLALAAERTLRQTLEDDPYWKYFRPRPENEEKAAEEKPAPLMFLAFAEPPDPKAEPPTPGGQWWTEYAVNRYKKPGTFAYYRDRVKALLKVETLANATLLEAADETFLARLDTRLRGLFGNRTVAANMMTLGMILETARTFKLIPERPKLPSQPKPKKARWHILSDAEEEIYLDAVRDLDQRTYFLMMIDTGIEPGPLARLAWPDVHLKHVGNFVHGYFRGRCEKRDLRDRDLALTPRLQALLTERWLAQGRPASGCVFPSPQQSRSRRPVSKSRFQNAHQRLWEETKNHAPIPLPKFRLYDLRHTCLTRFAAAGVTPYELKDIGGWTTIKMVDVYVHLASQWKGKAAVRLQEYNEKERAKRKAQEEFKEEIREEFADVEASS